MLSTWRNVHAMVEGRIRDAHILRSVHLHTMQLHFHMVFATARHVIHQTSLFIYLDNVAYLKVMLCKCIDQGAIKIVEVVIVESCSLRCPNEVLTIFQNAYLWRILSKTWQPLFANNYSSFSRIRITRTVFHDVLLTVGTVV